MVIAEGVRRRLGAIGHVLHDASGFLLDDCRLAATQHAEARHAATSRDRGRHVGTTLPRGFRVRDDGERPEGGNQLDHQRKEQRQTKTDSRDRHKSAREPCPEFTDRIGRQRATALAQLFHLLTQGGGASFELGRFVCGGKFFAQLGDLAARLRRSSIVLGAVRG